MDKTNEINNTNDTNNLKNENNINKVQNKPEEKVNINNNNNKNTTAKPKSNFVPSYNRSKEDAQKQESNTNNKKDKKGKIFKSKISIGIIVAVIAVLIIVCVLVITNINSDKISDYNKLMDNYGLSMLYNNQTSTSTDTITKSEAIKVILGATLNTDDITDSLPTNMVYEGSNEIDGIVVYGKGDESQKIEEAFTNEYWIKYAESVKYLNANEINKDNYNEEITYLDAIKYISNAKTVLLGKNLDIDTTPKFKDYDKYDNQTKWMLSDLAYNGIIEDDNIKINAEEIITKDKLNKLVINFVLKYNLITINNEKININEAKMPSNKNEFAYTLANIDKKVYETENYKSNDGYKTPIEVFANIKYDYKSIVNMVENYYNTILNVDYENINENTFLVEMYNLTMFVVTTYDIQNYSNYVKTNKIKITGEAKVQNPIIYFDGKSYRVRTKLSYNIESAENLENVLFLDKDTNHKLGKKEMYVDVAVQKDEFSSSYYIIPNSTFSIEAGKIK